MNGALREAQRLRRGGGGGGHEGEAEEEVPFFRNFEVLEGRLEREARVPSVIRDYGFLDALGGICRCRCIN